MDVDNESDCSQSVLSEHLSNLTPDETINMDNIYVKHAGSENDSQDMTGCLSTWAADHRITHSQLKPLLAKLREHNCFEDNIPKDPRTLLHTPRGKTMVKTI